MLPIIYVLWDKSYIWGHLVWQALVALDVPFVCISTLQVRQGILQAKPPALLLVPGGSARNKSDALALTGRTAIKEYVAAGGQYLGICGGVGLALSDQEGIGLCPWHRAGFSERNQHFISGHILSTVHTNTEFASFTHTSAPSPNTVSFTVPTASFTVPTALSVMSLPVWWPGRFNPNTHEDVTVLATYDTPDSDFWITDVPINTLPTGTLDEWENMYGIQLNPAFIKGQPCIVFNKYGKGGVLLTYSHLETPHSPDANLYLCHCITELSKRSGAPITCIPKTIPDWNLQKLPEQWSHPVLNKAKHILTDLMYIGENHYLFTKRTPWLYGWRAGIPGSNLNNLHTAVHSIISLKPTDNALQYLAETKKELGTMLDLFYQGVTGYLLAERLAITLSKTAPDAVTAPCLKAQRTALFGAPMKSDGLYDKILTTLDTIFFLQLQNT